MCVVSDLVKEALCSENSPQSYNKTEGSMVLQKLRLWTGPEREPGQNTKKDGHAQNLGAVSVQPVSTGMLAMPPRMLCEVDTMPGSWSVQGPP